MCEFQQVRSCLKISGMTHETLKWKLFPFSLSGEVKQWYIHVIGCVNGSWIELRDRFCSVFFPLSRICALRTEILTFCQNDKESIGVAWARFTLLVKSGPDFSLPEHLLLQHFYAGHDKESAHHLDLTTDKSLTKFWTKPLSFVSTSQFPQSPRCIKRNLQKSNRNPPKANQ